MPFWRKTKKYHVSQIPDKGNLMKEIPTMEEPNISLQTFSIIKDIPAEKCSDPSHSKPCDIGSKNTKKSAIRSLGSSAVIGAKELDRCFPNRRLRLYVATWNMEGKEFPQNLEDLLLPSDDTKDIYVIGVQEGCPNRREWEIKLQETLGPHYVLYHSSGLGVLYLTIFIRRELIWFCSEVEHTHVTTRLFHHVKTKGALSVAFTVFGTSFLFINSHMRFGAVYKRIQDYKTITEGLRLPQIIPERINSNALDVTSRFDRVFWFGDLNFQLKEDRKNVESLLKNIKGRDMSSLLKHDHLNEAKNNGSIFVGFKEHTIEFLPTYKFDIGTDTYDTSEKQRIPSYTDRVLFKSQYEGDVRVLRYDSCPVLKTSDHRPVFGIFEVKLRPGSDDIFLIPASHWLVEALTARSI
ncbi:phosphatidylinositol polyphosphate 5-phosphatase type IV-like isoform X2 [Rhinoderma darwinii]|uniref:phosphatidylinositol polyphosphate 5-phosphatase type IV-like isoform X2 n=1 Tax=Rhinoderma darwinii TaxID=43563 RepID=UPI003F67C9B9